MGVKLEVVAITVPDADAIVQGIREPNSSIDICSAIASPTFHNAEGRLGTHTCNRIAGTTGDVKTFIVQNFENVHTRKIASRLGNDSLTTKIEAVPLSPSVPSGIGAAAQSRSESPDIFFRPTRTRFTQDDSTVLGHIKMRCFEHLIVHTFNWGNASSLT